MKAGKYKVKIVNAGYLAMDGGSAFGIIPKALWERKVQCDEKNRLLMALNCLLLISDDRKILVDTGIGNGLSDKLRKIYNINDQTNLESSLTRLGIKPAEITDVLITHLHFDHAGGLINHKTGKIFFEEARYYASKKQFEWANSPSILDRASFKKRNYNPVYDSGKMQLLKEGEQPIAGLRLYQTDGHTPGMITLAIEDKKHPVYYCTDLFPTTYHVPLHYISAYDLHPLQLVREKIFFLKKAAKTGGIIIFPHDPNIVAATVEKINNDYQIKKTFEVIK
jgi:glyoxylase-like metal-dependent hydrolase (beta-lactamase superfamily II)